MKPLYKIKFLPIAEEEQNYELQKSILQIQFGEGCGKNVIDMAIQFPQYYCCMSATKEELKIFQEDSRKCGFDVVAELVIN